MSDSSLISQRLAQELHVSLNRVQAAINLLDNGATVPFIARYRKEVTGGLGPFPDREALKQVPRLGPRPFEQAAGFLRVPGGSNPLDASAVHPESYALVGRILADLKTDISKLIGNADLLKRLRADAYVDERFGLPTVTDILAELEKPGRDPRPEFHVASFREGVNALKDLQPGMVLEGTVTNVTNFGAFVDIGVHQDGLVHISALAERFIKDPREVVKAGAIIKVKVLEMDLERKRIALTLRLKDEVRPRQQQQRSVPSSRQDTLRHQPTADGALAAALNRAMSRQ
jgi:uncharacterized protein